MKYLILAAGCLIFCVGLAVAQQVMTFDELYGFDQVGDVQLSPDGSLLAFTLTHNDLDKHSRSSFIYLLPTDSGSAYRLTDRDNGEYSPRWSPNGDLLAFSSYGTGGSQIWIARPDSGDWREVTSLSTGAGGMAPGVNGWVLPEGQNGHRHKNAEGQETDHGQATCPPTRGVAQGQSLGGDQGPVPPAGQPT